MTVVRVVSAVYSGKGRYKLIIVNTGYASPRWTPTYNSSDRSSGRVCSNHDSLCNRSTGRWATSNRSSRLWHLCKIRNHGLREWLQGQLAYTLEIYLEARTSGPSGCSGSPNIEADSQGHSRKHQDQIPSPLSLRARVA